MAATARQRQLNAERQRRFRDRRQEELTASRREVETLRAELAQRTQFKTETAQQIVAALGELSEAKLAQVWVMLGERLKVRLGRDPGSTLPRGRQREAPAPRRGRNLAQYLYPSIRRPQRET